MGKQGKQAWNPGGCRHRGFTLVELMIALALLAIVTVVAVPTFTSTINNNRLSSASNDLAAVLQTARMEAVRRGQRVIVCPSANGSTCSGGAQWTGWLAFADANNDGTPQNAEILLADTVRAPMQLWTSASINSSGNRVVFRPDGMAYTNGGALLAGRFAACLTADRPAENVRDVTLSPAGQLTVDRRDNDGECDAPANP